MRTMVWRSWETLSCACLLAFVMALVCPVGVYLINSFGQMLFDGNPAAPIQIEGPALVGMLTGAVAGAYHGAALAARRVMRERGPAAVPPLVSVLLESEDERCRITAAEALGLLGPAARSAVPALRIACQDTSEMVRELAAKALVHIEANGGQEVSQVG